VAEVAWEIAPPNFQGTSVFFDDAGNTVCSGTQQVDVNEFRSKIRTTKVSSSGHVVWTADHQGLRRSPETDHLCSREVDQARNTDPDRDGQGVMVSRPVAHQSRSSSVRETLFERGFFFPLLPGAS
jgi:hypothetical protein